jgi:cytochrome P450
VGTVDESSKQLTRAENPSSSMTFDHRDDLSHNNPWPRWKQMREEDPVAFSEAYGGFHVISRYDDIAEIARNTEDFSSALIRNIPPLPGPRRPPIDYDPPASRLYRQILSPYFSLAKVAEYEPWIQELVFEIVDPLIASDAIDVPRDIGLPLTRRVILRIMGITDAPAELKEWIDTSVLEVDARSLDATEMIVDFLSHEIERCRKAPRSDLLSALLTAQFEGRPLRDDELVGAARLLLAGGLETTSSALSGAIAHLIDRADDRSRLLAEPEIWDAAMDEFVRWTGPVASVARTACRDSEVAGCPIRRGEPVLILFASGNRDEREFTDPDTVILDRHPNRHLGFGMGPHRCIGSHLAKLQLRLTLQRIVPTLGDWKIEDPRKVTWKAAGTRSMISLPLVRKEA